VAAVAVAVVLTLDNQDPLLVVAVVVEMLFLVALLLAL
jgi:hypothetical protein|tara:strand:+ start:106 stop:219 length:114 start_codon:yes stop_codon:yes gene_type:complete